MILGFAIGVLAARVDWLERMLRPVLDTMQTMPEFIYLIPMVGLFGGGRAARRVAAVIYALPAVIRITSQGLRQVDPAALEASRSLGATGQQLCRSSCRWPASAARRRSTRASSWSCPWSSSAA